MLLFIIINDSGLVERKLELRAEGLEKMDSSFMDPSP